MAKKGSNTKAERLVIFLIIDGWGIAGEGENNPFSLANTPFLDELIVEYPVAVLKSASIFKNKKNFSEQTYSCIGLGRIEEDIRKHFPLSLNTILSKADEKQVYVAESEKYSLLVDYFTGTNKTENTKTILVPSLVQEKFEERPELNIAEIRKELDNAIQDNDNSFIVASIANADILAHNGSKESIIKAIEIIDKELNKICKIALNKKATIIISSSHGKTEDFSGHDQATSNPVPLIVVGEQYAGLNLGWPDLVGKDLSTLKPIGDIRDLAPTILHLFGLSAPTVMSGKNLIKIK